MSQTVHQGWVTSVVTPLRFKVLSIWTWCLILRLQILIGIVAMQWSASHQHRCSMCKSITVGEASVLSYLQVHLFIRESGLPNFLGCRIPIPSALNIKFFRTNLDSYWDKVVVAYLQFGWPISVDSQAVDSVIRHAANNKSHWCYRITTGSIILFDS